MRSTLSRFRVAALFAATATLCCAAPVVPAAHADTPVGGCQGSGTITGGGGRDSVNAQRGHAGVVSASFRTTDQVPAGTTVRVQISSAPAGAAAPQASWRVDGGGWHGVALGQDRGPVGDAYWMGSGSALPALAAGEHRLELSVTVPADGPLVTYHPNVYFDTPAPCYLLIGSVGLGSVQMQGGSSGGSGGAATPTKRAATTPTPTARRSTGATPSAARTTAAPEPTATAGPASPSAAPTASPTADPAASASASVTASATGSAVAAPAPPTGIPAAAPVAADGGGAGWGTALGAAGVLVAGAGTAVVVRRSRRRAAGQAG
ncbi:hypothetical protein AB0D08_25845 [Kitasatospora sp. NPDC048540]|uniref:hypothetical protein n=1 Tax=Kitasatospora sp. NPDC048540 TaxID=3155634 RepID=UPI0033F5B42E